MTGGPTSIMEVALAKRLRSREDLQQRQICVTVLRDGGVALAKAGSRLGTWAWVDGAFAYRPEGGGETVTAQTIMGATALTAAIIDSSE